MLGQCCVGNFAFISSLLKGLFLKNDDVPGFENITMGGEVLIGKSRMGVWCYDGKNISSPEQQGNECVLGMSFDSS